jgi:2-amino-4-hydroxy-6-hydroxymethyldihydropteridine diphosphokinase
MAVRLECAPSVTPEALFEALMALEAELGRNRIMENRWGPRVIDIDLLAFGDERRSSPCLTLPHPRMHERAFVLLPLAEVAPEAATPELIGGLSFTASGTLLF